MSGEQVEALIHAYQQRYTPLITIEEAASIARCPKATLYDWSSRGLLDGFKSKPGRQVLLHLEAFVRFLASKRQ